MKIGILCGGNSCEHEISIVSALDLHRKIKNSFIIYIDKMNNLFYIKKPTLKNIIKKKGKKLEFKQGGFKRLNVDIVVSAVHGKGVEDGHISALLDFYNIPYIGSGMASSCLGMDKELTHLMLREHNVRSLDKKVLYNEIFKDDFEYPVILKPARLGSSIGISVSNNSEELKESVKKALVYDNKVLVEKYLKNYNEFSVAIAKTNKFYLSKIEEIERSGLIFDYNDKYKNRTKGYVHKYLEDDVLKDEIYKIAKNVYEIFECEDIVRIDFLYSDDLLYVNEINTIPGSLSSYLFDDFNSVLKNLLKYKLYNSKKNKVINVKLNEDILKLNTKK